MGYSLPVLAQNDSSRTSPPNKVLSDSIQIENDTITIGNMLIIKKKGVQNYNSNKSRSSITIGNVVIVKKQGEQNYTYNRKIRKPYSTTINITDGKMSNDTLLSVNEDTVRLGRLQIIKSQDSNYKKDWGSMIEWGDFDNTNFTIKRVPKTLKNIETNWFIFDLGFSNFIDKSPNLMWLAANPNALPYGPGPLMSPENFTLNNKKSTNVKYDVVSFTKNKLLVNYLTVPVQINFTPNPTNRKAFYASMGLSVGYLWNAKNKQISGERGKEKFRGNFNLNDWRFATIGELGLGSVRLYGSFANSNLFNKNQSYIDMQPFAVGLRFSKF